MDRDRANTIERHRQLQPIEELERKAFKAARWGIWTQEDVDLAMAKGELWAKWFAGNSDNQ